MTIDAKVPSDVFGLAKAAIKARPMFLSELRVIVHPFVSTAPEFGITDGGAFDGKMFPNFIIINSNKTWPDRLTLLHEMIYATGLTVHDDDPVVPRQSGIRRASFRSTTSGITYGRNTSNAWARCRGATSSRRFSRVNSRLP